MNEIVIREFMEEHGENVEEIGDNLFAKCPFCHKGYKHWNISLLTGEHHCYRCGKGGKFEWLCRYLTGKTSKGVISEYTENISLATLVDLYSKEAAIPVFVDWLEGTKPLSSKSLLVQKGITYLEERGISLEFAEEHGLQIGVSGKFAQSIIIPIYLNGEVVNFLARKFLGMGKRYNGPHTGETPVEKSALFWNWDVAKQHKEVVMVEGFFDAAAMKQEGVNVVALLGKEIHSAQVLKAVSVWDKVTVLLDGGFVKDAIKVGRALEGLTSSIKLAIMEPEHDPADFPVEAVKAVEMARDLSYF